jgi:predicted ATPase/DNA-binding CsgD family transcriptional regulator
MVDQIQPTHSTRFRPPIGRQSSLPAQPTPLVGRGSELAGVCAALRRADIRQLTLTGPAGVGKTRLAVETALNLAPDFQNGAVFVDLAPVRDADLMLPAVAHALGVQEAPQQPLIDTVTATLQQRQLLLVLDNFEQVLPSATLLAELMATCPKLSILVTSRAALRLRWEYEFPIPPLPVPDLDRLPPLSSLAQLPSVTLFVQRARAGKPDFTLTETNASAVAAICARLEGLPFAIELAAARVKLLPPQAMAEQMQRPLDLLTGGGPDLPPRQQTARGAFTWSYDLLPEDQQALLRRLSAFEGGCELDAIAAIARAGDEGLADLTGGLLDRLASLIDNNLLYQKEQPDGQPRYQLLELVKEYARERLEAAGEQEMMRCRHAAWCLALVNSATSAFSSPHEPEARNRLEREHNNLRATLRWAVEQGNPNFGLRLATGMSRFWCSSGYLAEGRRWLETFLSMPRASAWPALRVQALTDVGVMALGQGDVGPARANLEAGLTLAGEIGDTHAFARLLTTLGRVAIAEGDAAAAQAYAEESVSLFRSLGEHRNLGVALHFLGLATAVAGGAKARFWFEESIALFNAIGDTPDLALPLRGLGLHAFQQGDHDRARSFLEQSITLCRERGDLWSLGVLLHDLGYVARQQGDILRAAAAFRESLAIRRRLDNAGGSALCLVGLAGLAAIQGQYERAARLFGAAEAVREFSGVALELTDRASYDDSVAAARDALGEEVFDAAWAAGRSMSLSQAIAYALSNVQAPFTRARRAMTADERGSPCRLTRREREVLTLVARGLTNRQIGVELVIAEGTAALHVKHILHKLGFSTRAQAAAWCVQHGLTSAYATRPVP